MGRVSSGFSRKLNSLKASAWSKAGEILNTVDEKVARPLVKAENRVKVAALQVRQAGFDALASGSDAAGKVVDTAQVVVTRMKWVYIAAALLAAAFGWAYLRNSFRGK